MPKPNIKPVGDRLLVQFIEEKEQIRGGVIVPDSAREKPQAAKVLALGSGPRAKDGTVLPFSVKVGDTVLLGAYAGSEVKLDGLRYTLVREDDLLGLLA